MQGAAPAPAAAIAGPRSRELERLSATLNASPAVQRLEAMRPADRTGLPAQLRASVEAMSGVSLARVRVHRNSSRPAQLSARAFAQGSDIHLAPGQERHLPHEAWHVVQQAQGRVRPTIQLKGGVAVNDDPGLEGEADRMGARAMRAGAERDSPPALPRAPVQPRASGTIQRVVDPDPEDTFRSNEAWAVWFAKMSEAEVAAEAGSRGIYRAALVAMNRILTRKGKRNIKIPENYAGPPSLPQSPAAKPGAKGLASSSSAKTSDFESPMRIGAVAKPLDLSQKTERSRKTELKSVNPHVEFSVEQRKRDSQVYNVIEEHKNINAIPDEYLEKCYTNPREFFARKSDGHIAMKLQDRTYIVFDTEDPDLLGELITAIYDLRHEEPEPRSGKARAAPDDKRNTARARRDPEAPYSGAIVDIGEPDVDATGTAAHSAFTSKAGAGTIQNTIVHSGPWAKGVRSPGQSSVMGGQNAKNYYLDWTQYDGRPSAVPLDQRRVDLAALPGRYEWLHVIGSSLGGPNALGNLVCGTYDANTEMIALEHRIALWGQKGYKDGFKPTPRTPITIQGTARLVKKSYIASQITLTVSHGTDQVLERTYDTAKQIVITKKQYTKAERGIEDDIDKVKAERAKAKGSGKGKKK